MISSKFLKQEDIATTRQTIAKCIKKHNGTVTTTGSVQKRIGRQPKLNSEHLNFIDTEMENNDELCVVGKNS